MLGDSLSKLPTTRIGHDDPSNLRLLEELFPYSENDVNNINKIYMTYLDIIIAGVLFFLIGLPLSTRFIQKISYNSEMGLLFVKTMVFMILLFFINNFYLIKLN